MFMTTSQIFKFADSWKTQKSKYVENITQFSSSKKIHCLHLKGYAIAKNTFLAEVNFNSQ